LSDAPNDYALAHVLPTDDTWVADAWVTGPKIGEIESVGVLPEYRNRGIGARLLDTLEPELGESGVSDLILGVLPGDTAAIRLYERRGFQSTWVYLSRFAGRLEPRAR
jgi:ribosomal protein S18 acetylase RimI-like enzyme